ncbi:MAG: DNA translocase FtsK 4TM domain-containing protein, partial [Flavobacteriales bacterium]|nr:DNA translocase FtsK 4TM domain-containing protein [Flavobacteriales bacterium]
MRTLQHSSSSPNDKPARNVRKSVGSNENDKNPIKKSRRTARSTSNSIWFRALPPFLRNAWDDERVRSATGLFLLSLSAFLVLSTISSIFSGTSDMLLISSDSTTIPAHNLGGKLGALVGHYLVRNTFGFGFLAIPIILALIGFNALTGKMLLPFWKTTIWMLAAMVTLPWALGFFFYDQIPGSVEITLLISDHIIGAGSRFLLQTTIRLLGAALTFCAIIVLALFTLYQFYPGWHKKINLKNLGMLKRVAKFFSDNREELMEDTSEETPVVNTFTEPTEKEDSPPVAKKESEETSGEDEGLDLEVKEKKEEASLGNKEVNKLTQECDEYDPKSDLDSYKFPKLEHLANHGDGKHMVSDEELEVNKNKIIKTLRNFSIEVDDIKAEVGPTVTLYKIIPAPGIRISKIKNLEDDIALSLAALGIRIIAPIPGRGTIGIEVPNSKPDVVSMLTLIKSLE